MLHLLAAQSGDPLIDWFSEAGAIGVLAFVVVGFVRGWIVPGTTHKRALDGENRALDLVYKQAEMTQRALDVAEKRREP